MDEWRMAAGSITAATSPFSCTGQRRQLREALCCPCLQEDHAWEGFAR